MSLAVVGMSAFFGFLPPATSRAATTPATEAQLDAIRAGIRTGLDRGAPAVGLGIQYTYVDLMTDPAAADVAREISGRTNIPVVVYPDASHHVEPSNAEVEAKLRELALL